VQLSKPHISGRGTRQAWIFIFSCLCVAVASLAALEYSTIPYLWIFLSCSAALFAQAAIGTRSRALYVNLGFVFIPLAAFEYYLWESGIGAFVAHRVDEGTLEQIFMPDNLLGWAPKRGVAARQKRSFEGEVLYDVTYTIQPNGLRTSSPSEHRSDLSQECILFFGGSFMFGQGLEDSETLPFLINVASENHYSTYNFGVMGYGAHQMLSALQHDTVKNIVGCDPSRITHVFYQGIPDHVRRSAGRPWWSRRGPRYIMTDDDSVELVGRFEDIVGDESWWELIRTQIGRSRIYNAIYNSKYLSNYASSSIELYVGIVQQARELVRSSYPKSEFHVLWWDSDDIENSMIIGGLKQRGIDVRLMSEILPHYQPGDLNTIYHLHERDNHPNALANELIARYLLREVLP